MLDSNDDIKFDAGERKHIHHHRCHRRHFYDLMISIVVQKVSPKNDDFFS